MVRSKLYATPLMLARRARASTSDTPDVTGGSGSMGAAGRSALVKGRLSTGARWQAVASKARTTVKSRVWRSSVFMTKIGSTGNAAR